MVLLAFIPLIGVKLILLPAALIELLGGEIWQGLSILPASFLVILNVDNFLRPRLVGHRAGMHDLLVFFSTLGGLATFGVAGIIVGPVIAAFFVALVDIYAEAFHHELGESGDDANQSRTAPARRPPRTGTSPGWPHRPTSPASSARVSTPSPCAAATR